MNRAKTKSKTKSKNPTAWEASARLEAQSAELERARDALAEMTHTANLAQADAWRWRSECPVTAAHVEAAGVTFNQFAGWLESHGMSRPDCIGVGQREVAREIQRLARDVSRPAHDILDEMAALTVADGDAS